MPVGHRKTYSMTEALPDINLDPPDDITGEYEDDLDENGNVIELDDDYNPDDLADNDHGGYDYDDFDNNESFGGRNYP